MNITVVDLYVPCSPWNPSVAIATRVLELYRTTHVQCPQLAIQPFVKSLCDLHGVRQFSIAYDVYLELRRETDKLVASALGRDAPKWRLKHACPACTYKLEGEEELIFSILTAMGGNDSLKRVLRRSKMDGSEEEPTLGPSREREDLRDGGGNYFLSREQVGKWAKDRLADVLPSDTKNPCLDHWKNMLDNVTSRMWGIFDETGIFLALCRHGFVLVVADMVQSGQLSKYPIAILSFLATYVEGLGLEDLEGCEWYFSRSNGLAKSVRYASKFHRRQNISMFMQQIDDLETYANLSKFLCDNYQQALKILKTEPELKHWMAREGVEDYDSFHVARRHAVERRNRDLELVQDLESKLDISKRWTSDSPEWTLAVKSINDFKYQEVLDQIERIIVERLFEMTKMHRSETGYKMRKHIAKALQARSKAIKGAIDRYNSVALDMDPLMPTLTWDEVVDYGFLSEFDILRDTRDSIRSRPWTRSSYRVAMDNYFKILQAREEIKRLKIEIKRVMTWIDDEDRFLRRKENEYKVSNPALLVQISRYRQRRGRSDYNHMQRFWALAKTPGFTGCLVPGRAQLDAEMEVEVEEESRDRWVNEDGEWEDEDKGEEAQEEVVSTLLYQMSVLSVDRDEGRGGNQLD
ncbi:hypothetical protein C8R45DRAFT_1062043 [Mycena sanguinolenta]|nr:hypothetical protein C8R45DRAFT_1062043 [Mycena sanguinolenta]